MNSRFPAPRGRASDFHCARGGAPNRLSAFALAALAAAAILGVPRADAQSVPAQTAPPAAADGPGDASHRNVARGSKGPGLLTVLARLEEARLELARLKKIEAFLKTKELPANARSRESLRDLVMPLVEACLERGDYAAGDRIFRHAVSLALAHKAVGEWPQSIYTSWTFPSSLLRTIAHDAPGGGLERIAFHQFVTRRDGGATVKPSHSLPRFGDLMREVFEEAGGRVRNETALDVLATELHRQCPEAYPELLGIYFMEFLRQLPPPALRDAIAWADGRARSPDSEWAPLAREFAMAARLLLIKAVVPARQALREDLPDPDACQQHYLDVLRDEALPYPVRITIARSICSDNPRGLLASELVFACAEVLAEGLAADSPASAWACFYIAQEFNRFADRPEWETSARRLLAAWLHANRTNAADRRTEAGFWPDRPPAMEMMRLVAQLRDPQALTDFLADGFVKNCVKNNASALFVLVENGHHAKAAAFLPDGMDWMDISDDYPPMGRVEVRYNRRVHQELPAFLATVGDPALRYLAELLILGAPDPPPAGTGARTDADFPNRGQRLREAALGFAAVDFDKSPDGLHLRTRVFEQLAAFDGPAREVSAEWERDYSPEKALTVCSFVSSKNAEHAAPPFATFAAMRLRRGDLSGVTDMLDAVERGRGSPGVRRKALEHFSLRFLRAYSHHWPSASPDELALWRRAFDMLLERPEAELVSHPQLSRLAGTHLAATLLAAGDDGDPAWLASLDADRAALASAAVQQRTQDFLDGLQAALKYRVPQPHRAPPERRARATLVAFSHPAIQKAFGPANSTLFARLQAVGHLDRDQLLGDPGRQLAAAHRRGGWAAAELATMAAEAGDFETAVRWADRSLEDCGEPDGATERYARLAVAKVELLIEAGRSVEAIQFFDELDRQVDPESLPRSIRAALDATRRRAQRVSSDSEER